MRLSSQGWQVTCVACGELRWPYLPERPNQYTCTRCKSGAGSERRESARVASAARKQAKSRPSQAQTTAEGSE